MAQSRLDRIRSLIESGALDEALALATEAVAAERGTGGSGLADALALHATAARLAGQTEIARDSYAAALLLLAAADDPEGQMRATGADIWLARLAEDPAAARGHFEQASERRTRIQARWRGSGWTALLGVELAGELARLALDRGDAESALAELRGGLRAASAVTGESWEETSLADTATVVAQLLYANQEQPVAFDLLGSLAGYYQGRPTPDRLNAARAYRLLGRMLLDGGDPQQALRALVTAAGLFDADSGDRDVLLDLADALNYAGLAADRLGQYALSAECYEDALAIRTRLLPPDDHAVLLSRYNLAEIARVTGENEYAVREFEAVLSALPERPAGEDDRWLRRLTLKNLAQARIRAACPAEAEQAASEAIALGGADEAMQVQLLGILAAARRKQQAPPGSEVQDLERLAELVAERSGRQSLAYLSTMHLLAGALPPERLAAAEQIEASVIEQLAGAGEHDARTLRLDARFNLSAIRWARGAFDGALDALTAALPDAEEFAAERWRVRSAFAAADGPFEGVPTTLVRLAASHLTGSDAARRAAFRAAVGSKRRQAEALADQRALVLQGRTELLGPLLAAARLRSSAAWSGQDAELTARLDELRKLENTLARQVPRSALLDAARRSDAAVVAEALPPEVALVEYLHCPGLRFDGYDLEAADPRYIAFVLPSGQPDALRIWDLGPAAAIDRAVEDLRSLIAGGALPTAGWRERARALAALIWDPLAAALADTSAIFVAPDGGLCGVPFDALIDPDGQPLLETLTLTVLATGRDAGRMDNRANWRTNEPAVIAAPDFGEPWEPFGPLTGTIAEGSAVASLLDTDPVMGEEATRDFLLDLNNPEILHLATHGYYLEPAAADGLAARIGAAVARDPLLSSGIALAEANQLAPGEQGGVVTALDVLGLNLAGTDLVVLSACDSGLGPLSAGEGLLSLARSFLLAGARSVVWSMWRVDDLASAALIEDLYRRLLNESSRAAALRAAKRAIFARAPDRVDIWAAFVLQGDPGSLLRFRFAMVPQEQIYTETARLEGNVALLDTRGRPAAMHEVDLGGEEPLRFGSLNLRGSVLLFAEDKSADGQRQLEAGNLDAARERFEEALSDVAGVPGGRMLTAKLHDRLAILDAMRESYQDAREHGLAALDLLSGMDGVDDVRAVVLDNLGIVEVNLGDIDQGRGRLEESLRIKESARPRNERQIAFTQGVLEQVRAALRDDG